MERPGDPLAGERILLGRPGHGRLMPSPDDLAIIRAAIQGTDGAMDALADRYLPVVLGWARRLGGSRIQADDVAHDAWMVVMRRVGSVQDPGAFESWMYSVVRRVVAAHRRKAWLRRWVAGEVPDGADPDADPERDAQRSARSEAIGRALDRLRPHHREIIVLCDLEDRPDREVSILLGIPKGTVKSRLRRARKELRGILEAQRE